MKVWIFLHRFINILDLVSIISRLRITGRSDDSYDVTVTLYDVIDVFSRYAGVTQYEELPRTETSSQPLTTVAGSNKKSSAAAGAKSTGQAKLLPYAVACNAMQSFLTCKGCTSVAAVVAASNKDFSNEYYEATRTSDFAEVQRG